MGPMGPAEWEQKDEAPSVEPAHLRDTKETAAHMVPHPQVPGVARLLATGVGGAGSNALNRMIEAGVAGVEFVAMNTDAQALSISRTQRRIRLGETLTRGLGAGGNPDIGRKAAEESYSAIRDALVGADMVFVTAGMGGGTGTGASPLVAQAAREVGALTVAVVTTPFAFERRRKGIAEQGIVALREVVDALIVVPNERLIQLAGHQTGAFEAYRMADDVLRQGIQGISDLIMIPGLINLDFADIEVIMRDAGSALMSIGQARGEDRAQEAARAAITNPLLDVDISGARGVIFNIAGGEDLTMAEVNTIADVISGAAHADANIIFGTVYDSNLDGSLKITVVATGFEPRVVSDRLRTPRSRTSTPIAPASHPASHASTAQPVQPVRVMGPLPQSTQAPMSPAAEQTQQDAATGLRIRTVAPAQRDSFLVSTSDRRGEGDATRATAGGDNGSREAEKPRTDEALRVTPPLRERSLEVGRAPISGPIHSRSLLRGYHGDEFLANDEPEEAEVPPAPRHRWEQLFGRH